MNFDNTCINMRDDNPELPELIPVDDLDLIPSYSDIDAINQRLTSLSIEINT